ncbi:uncharacterized protein [Primulina huaijiensis]|uniref:uncharacterized protein n=1 Tax=Primulina huaijiensis TaxID=1492673 RepID=UPI003CC6F903
MSSLWSSSLRLIVSQWRPNRANRRYWILPHSRRLSTFISSHVSSSHDDNSCSPEKAHLGYDPSEELFGLSADLQSRKVTSVTSKPRSWFGPNGQYIRELPCPICRGRGYTPCTECGVERSRSDCLKCNGKGIVTCHQCLGDCVIWEEYIDEKPWEKARLISPLKVKEDDEVDNLDVKLDVRRKTKRVYLPTPPEVSLKISKTLKSLNAKTGIFSNRMKLIHGDPMLRAQRAASIKKTKGTGAARKRASESMKNYFRDPENRHKRSIAMKGVKFYCHNCGCEGHRRNYCPQATVRVALRQFRCRLCGEKGHNRRTCRRSKTSDQQIPAQKIHHCKICGQSGHNRRTCPHLAEAESTVTVNEDSSSPEGLLHAVSLEKKGTT